MTFREKVHAVVKKVPKGEVLSYKEVAKRADIDTEKPLKLKY